MPAELPKKLIIICILEILNKYTDADHRLSQKEIGDLLLRDYDLEVDRKAIKRNLMDLLEFGYDIDYDDTTTRVNSAGEKEAITANWYINHKFTDAELRLLIDGLLFSKHIPYSQCKDLIGKLVSLSNHHFQAHVKHIHNLPESRPKNPELLYTIEILDEAISKKKQVSFHYTYYGTDKEKLLRADKNGNPIEYLVNPYQMVGTGGRYYLICNLDKHNNIAHYRVDRISDIKLLSGRVKPKTKLKETERNLDLPKHMAEHIYMFHGEAVRVKFRTDKSVLSDIVDWFGMEFDVREQGDDAIEIQVKVNENAMYFWALQYGACVEILSPKRLRDRVKDTAEGMAAKYSG